MSWTTELIPTRRSLLDRLKKMDDQESWRSFFEIYWKLIYNTALKAGLTPTEAEDAVQETVISVMHSMPEFQYDPAKGSFKKWLLNLTSWRIQDQFRKRQKQFARGRRDTTAQDAETLESVPDPAGMKLEADWDEEWEQTLREAALERVKRKVDPIHYQIFDLSVFKEWSVAQVARAMKVNPGRVYLARHRVGKLIKKELANLKSKPLQPWEKSKIRKS